MSDVELPEVPEHPEGGWQGQPVVVSAARADEELAGVGRHAVQGEVVLVVAATNNLLSVDEGSLGGVFWDENYFVFTLISSSEALHRQPEGQINLGSVWFLG